MKHLITGWSGFLGNLIMRRLLEKGEVVTILDIWKPNFHWNVENILNNLYGNIMKKDELPALPQSATIESIKLDIIAQFMNSSK